MKPDGSGERILTTSYLDEGPTWAPNGRVLMFSRETRGGAPKLTPGLSWADTLLRTGIQTPPSTRGAALIMLISCASYIAIQAPAFAFAGEAVGPQARSESP